MAFPSVDQYERKLNVLKDHCNKMGRDPDTLLMTQLQAIIIAETDEKAKKKAKDSKFLGFSPIIGSPETVKNKLKKHIDIGVDYFMISFSPFPDTEGTIMFSEEVIPELREYHNQNI